MFFGFEVAVCGVFFGFLKPTQAKACGYQKIFDFWF
jgi:hypothetical protein